ncbi:glycosyltransferase [Pseudarthrobacter sp. P1]|uniref:glycosyltransferase n=1 Tax=Pseudarthrobacter sp. P1 TaxID=3418418 RepID=UPI003CF0492C
MTAPIEAMAIIIPARNEQSLLAACLAALTGSIAGFHEATTSVHVSVTVVLDRTTDSSQDILAGFPQINVVASSAGRVGSARNHGIRHALSLAESPRERIWILNTDADSTVPSNWMSQHWRLACEGSDVVTGTVEPHRDGMTARQLSLWHRAHDLSEGHAHVHGANLGFRADVYQRLGGYRDVPVHEDRDFVEAARTHGFLVRATDLCRVLTSGRRHSRVDGGFAGYLAHLSAQDAGLPAI